METWKSDLLKLARNTINSWFSRSSPNFTLHPEWLKKAAVFVTLTEKGELRGCIGSAEAFEEMYRNVMRNAINAAFHDPRFQPLKKHEMSNIEIEISILSKPEKIQFSNKEELKKKIQGKGVILINGNRRALFLPQVWEKVSGPDEFLEELCAKAGLGKDCWKSSESLIFDAEILKE